MPVEPNSAPIFSGEFRHALDGKNRVTIPSAWRSGEADEFFLVPGRTGSFLKVMPPVQFRAAAERAKMEVPAKEYSIFLRHFYSRSQHVAADKQGRLLIPDEFCQKANLRGEIVLIGALDTFEMWNSEAWSATQKDEEAIYEKVAEVAGL